MMKRKGKPHGSNTDVQPFLQEKRASSGSVNLCDASPKLTPIDFVLLLHEEAIGSCRRSKGLKIEPKLNCCYQTAVNNTKGKHPDSAGEGEKVGRKIS